MRFKELVQGQITKQNEEMLRIMKEVYKEFDKVTEKINSQKVKCIETISEDHNENTFEIGSEISEIKKLERKISNNNADIEKVFGDFNIKFDQSICQKGESLHSRYRSEGNFM